MIEFSKIKIGKGQRTDVEKIYSLEREYIFEYEPSNLAKWDSVKNKTMKLLYSNLERMFVAIVDGEMVGHGYWSMYLEEPCIYSIFILKEYRHKGIATNLMNAIEKQIFASGHQKVTLSTLKTNPAQLFFEKMDYQVMGTKDGWIYYSKAGIV